MKTKIFFITVLSIILIYGCKDKKSPAVEKIEKSLKEVTIEEFVVLAANFVDKNDLPEGKSIFIVKKGYEIIDFDSTLKGVRFENFPIIWEYNKLKPVVMKYPLSIQLICERGSFLPIWNLEEFLNLYCPEDGLYRVNPRPKYLVYAGDKIFLIGQEGGLWRSREEIEFERRLDFLKNILF